MTLRAMGDFGSLKASLAGRYDVEREVGAGGMATVYLARDLRHDREVALKLLNPELAHAVGAERFLTEIKVTANLRHPNLLPLYDSGEVDGQLFYVMPFVDGESLRARLNRERQLPVEDTIRIAVAVANALEYAHSHGVIHRDLKPENILLEHGEAVVADFGISLAVSRAGGNRITQSGISIGTPTYMSPEQATADPVIDHRTDIYSLGAITYEMLTGAPPYAASSPQAVYARMLMEKPRPIRGARPATPEHVEAAVMRALEQLPADRFSSARQFAEALRGHGSLAAFPKSADAQRVVGNRSGWRARLRDPVTLGLAIVAIALGAVLAWGRLGTASESRVTRFVLFTPDSARAFDYAPWPATISPDGRVVVYAVANSKAISLYSLRTNELEGRPIPGTDFAAQPLFSPDGDWLAFETANPPRLRKVRLDGSAPITIANVGSGNGADWTVDNQLVLGAETDTRGLARVSADGGDLIDIAKPDKAGTYYLWPISFADGKLVVFTIFPGTLASAELATVPTSGGEVIPLHVKGIRPLAVIGGTLVYVQADGAVMGARLDGSGRHVAGGSTPVLDPVAVPPAMNGNSGIFVSRTGGLVAQHGGTATQLAWIAPKGASHAPFGSAPILFSKAALNFVAARLSRDDRRLAAVHRHQDSYQLVVYDFADDAWAFLTSGDVIAAPSWTPDGKAVVYLKSTRDRLAVWQQAAEAGSLPQKLLDVPGLTTGAILSPDGRSLLLIMSNNGWDIFRVRLDSTRVPVPYVTGPGGQIDPRFSPDGRWVAWNSDVSGRAEVYASPFPDATSTVQISAAGGSEPLWSKDGKSIFYRSGSAIMAARLSRSAGLRVQSRDSVTARSPFEPSSFSDVVGPGDVSRDGRFLGLFPSKSDFQLVVVPNWTPELEQRLRASTKR